MVNPRPVPPYLRVIEASAWEKALNKAPVYSGDKSDQLAKEEAKNLTVTGEEELTATQKEATLKRNEGLTEIGSAMEKLDQDSQIREKAKDTTALYDAQKARTIRFANLNELIGQSSGAKFRSFAQTLAFERLVVNANLQLQKMTPRYLLKPDEGAGLSLDVIDNYQGGLIRPAKNLSGGESFLVSLALALGLSMTASANVEVNSLFLDEGFG
jgi:exonuclease SbcC